jgi:antiviral helicase SKI2
MDQLNGAFRRLSVAAKGIDDDTWIDNVLDERQARKRPKRSKDQLKRELQDEFLSPSTSFSTYWLNQLQRRWTPPSNYTGIFQMAPTQTRTIVRFNREGLEGRVTGYKEITVPANSATAKNSTSLLRKPANRAEFVRGAAGFFPFTPGGLDGVEAIANIEDQALQFNYQASSKNKGSLERVINFGAEGGLLETAPGLPRGMKPQALSDANEKDASEVQNTLEENPEPAADAEPGTVIIANTTNADEESEQGDGVDDGDIDALLPVEYPALAPHGELATRRDRNARKEWAHMVDVNREMSNFKELVPDMARQWPFELDTFQKEAVYHLENGDSVFVAAHTSAGKTVVAEYAIALAAKHMTKAIYTSPIKALSNQKFRDFRSTFDDVGILTGDVQIRPEAVCLIMTTEILRSMLYRGADLIRDVEFVIFDEVHYVNDLERGVVWEEVIIMLPEHVTLILLSATVPNTYEFASWVGRTKKKDIYVISTLKRPVPLEHYLWSNKGLHKIVNSEKEFLERGWKDANDALRNKDKADAANQSNPRGANIRDAGRGQQRGNQIRGGHGGAQRGSHVHARGRGSPSQGRGNIARTGRGGGRTTAAQDRNVWVHLVQHLRKTELLPACVFVFSKKRCEENADSLSNLDYCTAAEKSAIHMTVEKSIARLKPEDRQLPQILKLRELLSRGFAVHHGGMLPILKEVVEILFAKTLVKVLFATETFAMGLNLPTRTVTFSGFRKHDGRSFRDLLPGEYTQMAGRAGRRGLDIVGTVIIVNPGADEAPPVQRLKQMMLGDPTKLRSQFRLTYNMILNLLRVEALKIEEMIKRSFSEDAAQALLPEHEKQVRLSEADLAKIKREPCPICDIDLEECHEACMKYSELNAELHSKLLGHPYGRRFFAPQRLIVFKENGVRRIGMLIQEGFNRGKEPTVPVVVFNAAAKRSPGDVLPYLPHFTQYFSPLPQTTSDVTFGVIAIPAKLIECVTQSLINYNMPMSLLNSKKVTDGLAREEILPLCQSWNWKDWDECDWSKIKDLSIRTLFDERTNRAKMAVERACLDCPQFLKHFTMQHDEWLIKENIAQLRQLMSDQNLRLLPDYEQRVEVLKELGFIDEGLRVELKGKVACEVSAGRMMACWSNVLQIHTADELVLTELVLENVLADYEPEEIVALLSAFVFQEKSENTPNLISSLEKGRAKILEISERVTDVQVKHQVVDASEDADGFLNAGRFAMVEVVYEWARGMSFKRITDLTDVMEGTIVRVITRLDETCREVKNAARIIGDPTLYQKMGTCQEMIKRDVCAVASLYM